MNQRKEGGVECGRLVCFVVGKSVVRASGLPDTSERPLVCSLPQHSQFKNEASCFGPSPFAANHSRY